MGQLLSQKRKRRNAPVFVIGDPIGFTQVHRVDPEDFKNATKDSISTDIILSLIAKKSAKPLDNSVKTEQNEVKKEVPTSRVDDSKPHSQASQSLTSSSSPNTESAKENIESTNKPQIADSISSKTGECTQESGQFVPPTTNISNKMSSEIDESLNIASNSKLTGDVTNNQQEPEVLQPEPTKASSSAHTDEPPSEN